MRRDDAGTMRRDDAGPAGHSPPAPVWADRLRSAGGQFGTAFKSLEQVFLDTGDRLNELHGDVDTLSRRAEAAGALLSSPDFGGLLRGLTDAAGDIDALGGNHVGLVETLDGMVGTLDAMTRSTDGLRQIMFHIRVLAVNARIEASQITASGTDFSVFIRGIADLARTGDQTIGAVRHELDSLRVAADRARDGQLVFERQAMAELETLARRLLTWIRTLSQCQESAAHGVEEIPGHLRRLFSSIGDLVANLQAYDIIRQRLEHLAEGREDAARRLETGVVPAANETEVRQFVNAVADLQALQMLHADEEYQQVVTDVGRNLSAMAQGIPELEALCARSFGAGEGSLSLLEIEADIKKARTLLAEFRLHRQTAEGNLAEVVGTAARAGDLMRRLNGVHADMRLMSLNAAIKCGNLGDRARSLNVIAQELQGYATLTQGHVEMIIAGLGTIMDTARGIGAGDGNGGDTQAWHAGLDRLNAVLEQTMARLQRTGSEVAGLLKEIGDVAPRVVGLTLAAEQGFTGHADCRDAAGRSIAELKTLVAATATPAPMAGTASGVTRADMLAFVKERYSLASERMIHDVATGQRPRAAAGGARTVPASSFEGEPDISDLLF